MLFQNKCLLPLACMCMLTVATGCKQLAHSSPENYKLGHPQRTFLGKALNEISGITFSGKKSLLAVSDSKEKIFEIDLKTRKLKDYSDKVVDKDSDLEDVVKVDSAVYLLKSKGTLVEVKEGATDSARIASYNVPLSGKNDFETVYYDPTANALVLLCKTCEHEKGKGIRTAFRFDLSTKTFDTTAFFTINKDEVRRLLKDSEVKFDPSAAAIHPVNKRLYILSSASNLLVITDTRGKVIEAYKLNPDDFPQAEGIAFAENGDMYVSNEGKNGAPDLLFFPFHPHDKKKGNQ